jgi:hypothetical protein
LNGQDNKHRGKKGKQYVHKELTAKPGGEQADLCGWVSPAFWDWSNDIFC